MENGITETLATVSLAIAGLLLWLGFIKGCQKSVAPFIVTLLLVLASAFLLDNSSFIYKVLLEKNINHELEPVIVVGAQFSGDRKVSGKIDVSYQDKPESYHQGVKRLINSVSFSLVVISFIPLFLGILSLNKNSQKFWKVFLLRLGLVVFSASLWSYGVGSDMRVLDYSWDVGGIGYWIQTIIIMTLLFGFPLATSIAWASANSVDESISRFEKLLVALTIFLIGCLAVVDVGLVLISFMGTFFKDNSQPLWVFIGGLSLIFFGKINILGFLFEEFLKLISIRE